MSIFGKSAAEIQWFHHKKRCSLLLFVLNSSGSLSKMTRNKKERENVHTGNAEVPSETFADAMTFIHRKTAQSSENYENWCMGVQVSTVFMENSLRTPGESQSLKYLMIPRFYCWVSSQKINNKIKSLLQNNNCVPSFGGLFFNLFIYFMFISVLPSHVSVPHMCTWCL